MGSRTTISLGAALLAVPDLLPADLRDWFLRAVGSLAARPCMTSTDVLPSAPWRTYSRPGLSTRDERWPDYWDGVDWQRYIDERLTAIGRATTVQTLIRSASPSLADLIEERPRSSRDIAEIILASSPWLWAVDPEEGYTIDPFAWSTSDRLRILGLIWGSDANYRLHPAAVGEIALLAGHSEAETIAFIDYVEAAARGLVAPDDRTREVLREYSTGQLEPLRRRLAMMEALVAPGNQDEIIEDSTDILDTYEAPLELAPFVEVAPEDGQPDPLREVRKLLPGGPGVFGRPPIVYTPTQLDTALLPYLRVHEPTLVVLSGNAGDGKTAFITSVLEAAGHAYFAGHNEYSIDLDGGQYLVVLDGSEDSEDRSNDQLLSEAFSSFRGDNAVTVDRGTIIAVNKGRMLAFLETRAIDYPYLWRAVGDRFVRGTDDAAVPYLLLDLNDRSVVSPDESHSLSGGVLDRLVRWEGWQSCDGCDARDQCPVLFNVKSLAKPVASGQFWRIMRAIDLDDRIHVTARHLVTKMASTIAGEMRCPDIRRTVAEGRPFDSRAFFYNSVFASEEGQSASNDAVIDRVAAAYDPSGLGYPRADRQIAFHLVQGSLVDLLADDGAPDRASLLDAATALEAGSIETDPTPDQAEYRRTMIDLAARIARRLFFTDPDSELSPRFPLQSLDRFVSLLADDDEGRSHALLPLLDSLNATLGIEPGGISGLVVPRDHARGLRGTGFALVIPEGRFKLVAGTALGTTYHDRRFLSSWPRSLLLRAVDTADREVARLSIPMLMYEILYRAAEGFRPISQTERAYMIRLQSFYRALASRAWGESSTYVLYENGRLLARASFGAGGAVFGPA